MWIRLRWQKGSRCRSSLLTIRRAVEKQRETDMFVVIGNPPYNIGQVNENDNNKNRKYKTMDQRIADTYVKDSKATLRRGSLRSIHKGDSMGIGTGLERKVLSPS